LIGLAGAHDGARHSGRGAIPKFTKEVNEMYWLVKHLATLIGSYYAAAMERAISSLPYEALDAT
jgi:hypothetical protein